MPPVLGCIADDFTGATDLAGMLVKEGMRTVQLIDVPGADLPVPEADALVVALKSRTIEPADAISQSRAALAWLQAAGCRRFFFKYCSTFDSTDQGNIGPVAEALLEDLGSDFSIACPALPVNGRSVYRGHLFVGDVLLNESGMADHPLTPMTDANLVRVLDRQTDCRVGLVSYDVVSRGRDAIASAMTSLRDDGIRMAIVDAVLDRDLREIGAAVAGLPLVTGGSGVAIGLPEAYRHAGLLTGNAAAAGRLGAVKGGCAVVAGSCSVATQAQVALMEAHAPAFRIDPLLLAEGQDQAAAALEWAAPLLAEGPVLVYATAAPETVRAAQERIGKERAGALVEEALATVGAGLVLAGVRRLVVAGGETSGAVVRALGVRGLRIGPEIDPGVPWTESLGEPPLHLALKSGNFGSEDFFLKAFTVAA